MNRRRHGYRKNGAESKTSEIARKGKTRLFFDRFKGCVAAGAIGLALVTGSAAVYGADTTEKEQTQEIKKQKPKKIYKQQMNEQLLEAAEKGQTKKVKNLLKNGADVNAKDADTEWTALEYAAAYGRTKTVELLLNKGADNRDNALRLAASWGHTKTVKLLIEKEADVNAKGDLGVTALMSAYSHTEVVKLLLDKGADVNVKDENGSTALILASFGGSPTEVVKLLLDKGADVNAKTKDGRTALLSASSMGNAEIVKLLLDKGADVNTKDKGEWTNGWTALEHATVAGYPKVVKLLLNAGADVNAKDENGSTVLAIAKTLYGLVKNDFMAVIELNDDIDTEVAIEYCKYEMAKYEEIIKLLKEHGAKE